MRQRLFLNPPASDLEAEGERKMNKRERQIGHLAVFGLLSGGLILALLTFRSAPAIAHVVPSPCDFTTGGGFVITDPTPTDGSKHANFGLDRKSTRLNSSHQIISYAVFCLKKKKKIEREDVERLQHVPEYIVR